MRRAAQEPSVEAKVDLLFEVAQLAEETLGDRQLAATAYRKVLEVQPEDRTALKSLRAVLA